MRRALFRSLAVPDFRWFAGASLMVNVAMWMQRIAQDWLAIRITGQGATVGIVTALQFLPVLLLSPFAGTIADRVSKRSVLTASGLLLGSTAIVLGAVVGWGAVTRYQLYGFAVLLGVAAAVDAPARMAYVRSFITDANLVNAMGLSALIFHSARVIGPMLAGLLMAWSGIAAAFLTVGGCHLIATALLYGITAESSSGAVRAPARLGAAIAELRRQPQVLVLMALATVVCSFSMNFQITITVMATRVFALSAGQFGGLTSLMAAGSIVGALGVASLKRPSHRIVLGAAAGLGLAYLVAALCRTPVQFGLALLPIGLLSNLYLATSSASVQLQVARAIQGRAVGLYQASSYALVPLSAALIGYAADAWSPRGPLALAGAACLVAAATAFVFLTLLEERREDGAQRSTSGVVTKTIKSLWRGYQRHSAVEQLRDPPRDHSAGASIRPLPFDLRGPHVTEEPSI